jgi:hypothetical protein
MLHWRTLFTLLLLLWLLLAIHLVLSLLPHPPRGQ